MTKNKKSSKKYRETIIKEVGLSKKVVKENAWIIEMIFNFGASKDFNNKVKNIRKEWLELLPDVNDDQKKKTKRSYK